MANGPAFRLLSIILAVMVLLPVLATAQEVPSQVFVVPETGYSGTDTYFPEDLWNEYQMHVPKGYELVYSVVADTGQFSIFLIPEIGTEYIFQGSYYISYSSKEPVTEFTRTFPADYGFDQIYTIVVNSSAEVTYHIDIQISEKALPDYTPYYVLIGLGLVGLVVFSWKYVNWQHDKEKQAKQAERDSRRGRRKR